MILILLLSILYNTSVYLLIFCNIFTTPTEVSYGLKFLALYVF